MGSIRLKIKANVISAIMMMGALLWLTISLPYVNAFKIEQESIGAPFNSQMPDEKCETNPGGAVEEKTESSNSLSEYLHDHHSSAQHEKHIKNFEKCHGSKTYEAWHPELISPPPEAASIHII